MLPLAVAHIVVGKLFEKFHVRGQADTDMSAFDEIVTEQPLLGKTMCEYFVERSDIINALAVIDRFAKDVLVEIRNRLGVWIAPRASVNSLEKRDAVADGVVMLTRG